MPRPREGTAWKSRVDEKKKMNKGVKQRWREDKKKYTKLFTKKEKEREERERERERERKVIDGRRWLPEDYTSRRLQFTPFGKLDIHRGAFSTRFLPLSPPPPPSFLLWPSTNEIRSRLNFKRRCKSNQARYESSDEAEENKTGEVLRRQWVCLHIRETRVI